jgi:glycosyltransferase involved in cell wall biosynthesis
MLSKMFNIPVIFHLHGSEFKQFYENSWKVGKLFIKYIINLSDRVIVLSSQWEDYLSQTISVKTVTLKLFNYVPSIAFCNNLAQSRENATLLFLGEIGFRKGIFDLLKVISRLAVSFPNLRLYCCGNGNLEQLVGTAKNLGIDNNIEIKGWVTGELKKELLAKSTIFVLPSYNEGLPVALLEAMAARLPIVSTFVGGIPDAVEDGLEGILIKPGDLDALEAAIRKLLLDSTLRTSMGLSARQKFEQHFTPERVLPKIDQLYYTLIYHDNV